MINRTHYCFFLILWSQFVSIQNVTCFLVSLSNIWESPILRITYFSVTGESNAGVSQKWGPAKTYPPSPPHHHHLPPHICTWYIIIYLYIYISLKIEASQHPIPSVLDEPGSLSRPPFSPRWRWGWSSRMGWNNAIADGYNIDLAPFRMCAMATNISNQGILDSQFF